MSEFKLTGSKTGNYWKIENGKREFYDKSGQKIEEAIFLEQENAKIENGHIVASENDANELYKESAKKIVEDLNNATKGWNDKDSIRSALSRINNPQEFKEVEKLLKESNNYKENNLYSIMENFILEELGDDELESIIQKWINNGTLKGQDANKAQARLAVRIIIDGGDGFGTDVDKIKKGISYIKSPTKNDNITEERSNAKAVYNEVNRIISNHKTFHGLGTRSNDLKDYLKGEVWNSEIAYLDGILAQNNAIHDSSKAKAVKNLIRESVEGAGTNIESFKQAILAINSQEDMATINQELREYCKEKGIQNQTNGQYALQAIMYDELDNFAGLTTNHEEIRKFNETLIAQGAYSKNDIIKIRAEQAVLQILEGDFDNIQDAVKQITDVEVLDKVNDLLVEKNYIGLDDFLNKKLKNQKDRDLINAELASNNLLSDSKATEIAIRLLNEKDFDTRAMGLKSIRNEKVANNVNEKLKENGLSLSDIMQKFNQQKSEYKTKAVVWDGLAMFLGIGAEHVSDKYRENTDMTDDFYIESENSVNIDEKTRTNYKSTISKLESDYEKMKQDYEKALEQQGVISGIVNQILSLHNMGTTRDDIEARLEHDKETIRLLKIASEGKLSKIVNGEVVNVSFEDVFRERQSEFISANEVSISGLKELFNSKEEINYDKDSTENVANQAQEIALMEVAKEHFVDSWSELVQGKKSNDKIALISGIENTLKTLTQLTGQDFSLEPLGYRLAGSTIVDASNNEVSLDILKDIATKLQLSMSDISKIVYNAEFPLNSDAENISNIIDKAKENRLKQFKDDYKNALGQEPTDEMIESYLTSIQTGVTIANMAAMIGTTILTAGIGSAAIFVGVGTTSLGLKGIEQSTDSDGWTNKEWTDSLEQAIWDGALATAGVKVGQIAEKFATNTNVLLKNKEWLTNFSKSKMLNKIPQLQNNEKLLSKIAYWTTRVEATFGEVASDSLQALVQQYCMNGEFDEEGFVTQLIMSFGFNAVGHVKSGFKMQDLMNADIQYSQADIVRMRRQGQYISVDENGNVLKNVDGKEVQIGIAKQDVTQTHLSKNEIKNETPKIEAEDKKIISVDNKIENFEYRQIAETSFEVKDPEGNVRYYIGMSKDDLILKLKEEYNIPIKEKLIAKGQKKIKNIPIVRNIRNGISNAKNAIKEKFKIIKENGKFYDPYLSYKDEPFNALQKVKELIATPEYEDVMTRWKKHLDDHGIVVKDADSFENPEHYLQYMIETSGVGPTKFAQIISNTNTVMDNIEQYSPEFATAIKGTRSGCSPSRSIIEAQRVIDEAFPDKGYKITSNSAKAASMGETYFVTAPDGSEHVVKMLKNGVDAEQLEIEKEFYSLLIKTFNPDPVAAQQQIDVLHQCYKDWSGELDFNSEFAANQKLAQGATRYKIAAATDISSDGRCMVMDKAQGIQMDKLSKMLKFYKENPTEYMSEYSKEISQYPWLADPDAIIEDLPVALMKAFDEQFMFMKDGGASLMHGDPHMGNYFITTDAKGNLVPEFIDTGLCIERSGQKINSDINFFINYFVGNTRGISEYFVDLCEIDSSKRDELIALVENDVKNEIFNTQENITNFASIQQSINTILARYDLTMSSAESTALKAQLQFFTGISDISRLSGKTMDIQPIIKDLPEAVSRMIKFGVNPWDAIKKALKFSFHNQEQSVSTAYQFILKK